MTRFHPPSVVVALILLFFPGSIAMNLHGQTLLEAGPLLGVSWYNGDLNPQRQFYRPHPAAGVIVRYSVNDRVAFRGGASLVTISGAYPSGDVVLPRGNSTHYSFKRSFGDFTAMMELNFFSFDRPFDNEPQFTPYVTFGIGSVFYQRYLQENVSNTGNPLFVLSLPFGGGVKWKLANGLKLGLEWTFRRTFADDIDLTGTNSPVNPADPYGFNRGTITHNNDWFSVIGVTAAFSLINRRIPCHAGYRQ